MSKEFTDSNFEEEVINQEGLTVVDFWAPWCGPCKVLSPIIDKVSKAYDGKAIIGKLNVDDNTAKTTEYGIKSIPSILLFKDGKEISRTTGIRNESQLKEFIDANL